MNKQVALLERIVNEPVGFLKVRSHFVAWNVECVDDLMVDIVLFGVINVHRGR